MNLPELKRLVRKGEGLQLEFKRKANHPDKISKEIVAFANSSGGILLIGVEDDGEIYGSKTPDEDAYAIRNFVERHCRPRIDMRMQKVPLSAYREVLVIEVKESRRKPHYLKLESEGGKKSTYIRIEDMSVRASREMVQLLRHEGRKKGVSLVFGEKEKTLLQYFEQLPKITLEEAARLLSISRRHASTLLILMVRAGLLHIHPTREGDYFTLSEEAFAD